MGRLFRIFQGGGGGEDMRLLQNLEPVPIQLTPFDDYLQQLHGRKDFPWISNSTLIKTEYGFWRISTPLPTSQELAQHYSSKYYQEGMGSYSVDYLADEIDYFRLRARLDPAPD